MIKDNTAAFTLIEVLIVVIIIAILTAIGIPMYQKAVLKTRVSALIPITKSLAESNEFYYLDHGTYSLNPEDLTVQGQDEYPDGTIIDIEDSDDFSYIMASNDQTLPDHRYIVFLQRSKNFAGKSVCEARNEKAGEICTSLGGTILEGSLTDDWLAYLVDGQMNGNDTFDRTCSGTPETDQLCGCDTQTRTATCNTKTGEWNYGEWQGGCRTFKEETKVSYIGGRRCTASVGYNCEDGVWVEDMNSPRSMYCQSGGGAD